MKRKIAFYSLYLLLPLLAAGIIYCAGSFYNFDFNPATWGDGSRSVVSVLGTLFLFLGLIPATMINEEHNSR